MAVPANWCVLPDTTADDTGTVRAQACRALRQLLRRVEEMDVSLCAFGPLDHLSPAPRAPADGPTVGAAVVVGVRADPGPGALRTEAAMVAAADPGSNPRHELCRLGVAGTAGRLTWTPLLGPDSGRVACAEYWLAVPGDGPQMAVVASAVVGAAPCSAHFDAMDHLAATAAFLVPAPAPR